jgi:hypothetical protein
MADQPSRAYTEEEQKKHDAEAALDALVKPLMADQNRFMTGDGTVGNPVRESVSDQLASQKPEEPAQPDKPSAYEAEYAAATTAKEKAQVAAKYEDWQKAYGNAQNVIGEERTRAATYQEQLDSIRSQAVQQPAQQPVQQQDPYTAFNNFQVVQPKDEYDTEAQRINDALRQYTIMLGQGIEQRYGSQIQQLNQTIEGLQKMPQNYAVDPATEATLVNELNLGTLPEWQQKQIVQRIAGQQTNSSTRTTTPRQTPQERTVQRAVNYVEPSDTTTSNEPTVNPQVRIMQEYEAARAKETDPYKKNLAGRKVLLKYGVKEVDDHRKLPPM